MAHENRIRTPGFWVAGSVVGSAEFEAFDAAQFAAANGDGGGTYSPASALSWGGSFGHAFSCPVAFASSAVLTFATGAAMSGNVNLPSELVFTGTNARFGGGSFLSFSTNSYLQLNSASNYIDVIGGAQIKIETGSVINVFSGGEIVVAGEIIVQSGALTVWQSGATMSGLSGSIVSLGGTNSIGGTLALSATTTRTGSITASGTGGYDVKRTHTLTTTTPQTITATDYDVWVIQTTLGANQTLNINDGTVIGQHARFIRGGTPDANGCSLVVSGGGPWNFPNITAGYVELMWTGTTWLPIDASHGLNIFN